MDKKCPQCGLVGEHPEECPLPYKCILCNKFDHIMGEKPYVELELQEEAVDLMAWNNLPY